MRDATKEYVRVALLGCGVRGRTAYVPGFLHDARRTRVVGLCDPDPDALHHAREALTVGRAAAPRTFGHEDDLFNTLGRSLDSVVIASPPTAHHRQIRAALTHGIDVLVEKPATMTRAQTDDLIGRAAAGGPRVYVAFQGALTPAREHARALLRASDGMSTVRGSIWQDWLRMHAGAWRQRAADNVGGYIFDTGLHLLHAVVDLLGPIAEVRARATAEPAGLRLGADITARSVGGVPLDLRMDGDRRRMPTGSRIATVTSHGVVETGAWGEYLRVRGPGCRAELHTPPTGAAVWRAFVNARRRPNPGLCDLPTWREVQSCYDAIIESLDTGGRTVTVSGRTATRPLPPRSVPALREYC